MFDWEFRIGVGNAVMLLCWGTMVGLLVASWLTGVSGIAQVGLAFGAVGAALTVVCENAKTRRVVRAVARDTPPPRVRALKE